MGVQGPGLYSSGRENAEYFSDGTEHSAVFLYFFSLFGLAGLAGSGEGLLAILLPPWGIFCIQLGTYALGIFLVGSGLTLYRLVFWTLTLLWAAKGLSFALQYVPAQFAFVVFILELAAGFIGALCSSLVVCAGLALFYRAIRHDSFCVTCSKYITAILLAIASVMALMRFVDERIVYGVLVLLAMVFFGNIRVIGRSPAFYAPLTASGQLGFAALSSRYIPLYFLALVEGLLFMAILCGLAGVASFLQIGNLGLLGIFVGLLISAAVAGSVVQRFGPVPCLASVCLLVLAAALTAVFWSVALGIYLCAGLVLLCPMAFIASAHKVKLSVAKDELFTSRAIAHSVLVLLFLLVQLAQRFAPDPAGVSGIVETALVELAALFATGSSLLHVPLVAGAVLVVGTVPLLLTLWASTVPDHHQSRPSLSLR
ncbi:hypothetical protein LJC59_07575 [Desulfovibrio sp. OttesenSCG-928-A18]|nr:hypothetical protein [Desulfovibrio sp. OttesenSCG-928-A18]